MQRDIDISLLRTFLAVAEHRNMTHAANLRNLTQPAVSQQIKRLEEILGGAVLSRSSAGVSLTEAGHTLHPHALQMVRANDDIVASLLNIRGDVEIRLGVPQDVVSSLLPSALVTFHKAEPDAHVTLVSASSRDLMVMLKEGEVDLALTTDRRANPNARVLFRKQLVWIGAIGGRAHAKSPLPVAVGAEACPFRQAASAALAKNRVAWRPVTQVGSLEPVFATLLADLAVAPFLPGTLPPGTEVIYTPLPDLPEFILHLHTPDRDLAKAEKQLCQAIIDHIEE